MPILIKIPINHETNKTKTCDTGANHKRETTILCRDKKSILKYVENITHYFSNETIHRLILTIENPDIPINDIISEIVNIMANAGIRKKASCQQNSQAPWFDNECRGLKQLKLKLLRKFRSSRSEDDLAQYKTARKTFKNIIDEKREAYNTKKLDDLINSVNDSKSFWAKLKSLTRKGKAKSTNKISKTDWLKHFENLFANPDENNEFDDLQIVEPDSEIEELIFNSEITDDEILFAVKSMKAGKSPGPDGILPEMFTSIIEIMLPILNKLLNRIFAQGQFPDIWSKSIIIPIHKKGDTDLVDNYRGISLLDIFGKIYTSILNRRLTFYVNMYGKIAEAQSGFREGYSTTDNAFILMSIIQKYLYKKKGKVYVCFVDFQKAFDCVSRDKLWRVLKTVGVKGNLFRVVKDMYRCVKACVRVNDEYTDYFNCKVGLKQGCLLSPMIFSIFINDLTELIQNSSIRGIQLFPDLVEIFMLFFADDIALISDTISGLQKQLDILLKYCKEYKMIVNIIKTKVMVFRRGGMLSRREKWKYNGKILEVVNGFQYVGLMFSTQLSLHRMATELATKGKRVLVSILSSLHQYGTLDKNSFFKIFDTKVCPILLYGSEIWGLGMRENIERIQYYLCKRFLNVSVRAHNIATLGECGRYPLYILTTIKAIKYWNKILHMPEHRYVHKCYKMLYYLDSVGKQNWASEVKQVLQNNGFGYIWDQQEIANEKQFFKQLEQCLRDQFIQKWHEELEKSSKLELYNGFKVHFQSETYLDVLKIFKYRHIYATFRLSCHDLEIEVGRHRDIDRELRKCPFGCDRIEDEYHFLLVCDKFKEIRNQYIPFKYINNPNIHKFNMLLSSNNVDIIQSLSAYLYHAFRLRQSMLDMY